ncbi:hypothetical protein [Caballeronia sp. dw_19]|uniref:hypothetical protein n=1 Tax=Caballeronia sp. dw_19 TaxID=2719791 RepID=UPI001BD1382A|nr:hypothetical protein [Caballeronia sp. dw_19]
MKRPKRPDPYKEVYEFNARVQVGETVEYSEVIGLSTPVVYRTRTEASILSGHTAVVWLEGKSGCVCVSHCAPVRAGSPA